MESPQSYIPLDRRRSLAVGRALPTTANGAVLFADISGFTPLTEALVRAFGPQRGAEELTLQLNRVYDALIAEVHRYRGSVIGFSGDAITCWLADDNGARAVACALAMQLAMQQFAALRTPTGNTFTLAMKVSIATGTVRRFVVGDPDIQLIDVMAGAALDRMATGEHQAQRGEILISSETVGALGAQVHITEWRYDLTQDGSYAVVGGLDIDFDSDLLDRPSDVLHEEYKLPEEQIRSWVLRSVYDRLRTNQGLFLAEMRPVTALFLRFQGIDYENDPWAGEQLNAYVRWVQGILQYYESSLIQVTVGDKGSYLYAAFGAPVAHDDDTIRAVAAALDLRNMPPELDYIHSVQIGMARGQMRTGSYGSVGRRLTYGVLGDNTNIAARLMSLAEPGQILVTQRITEIADKLYQFEPLGAVAVKGKSEPLVIAQLIGQQRLAVNRRLALLGIENPLRAAAGENGRIKRLVQLVGRTHEAQVLDQALEDLHQRKGQIILIEGEAGIGKSRLVDELARLMYERELIGLLGVGQSIEQQTPYRAWRDVFNAHFGLDGIEDPNLAQSYVEHAVHTAVPEHVERLPLLNDVLNLNLPDTPLTATLDPALRQQNLSMLLLALLKARAREQPLVLVLEDVHWLDSLSWELTLQCANVLVAAGEPLLLVLVTRPAEEYSIAHRSIISLRQLDNVIDLQLDDLSPDDTVRLAARQLGLPDDGLPAEIAQLVRNRADGNPFVAEQLVLMLRDRGSLIIEPVPEQVSQGLDENPPSLLRGRVQGDIDEVARTLPDNVQGLILARLDRLHPEMQLPLKVGAVIGRSFAYTTLFETLREHTQIEEGQLNEHLEQLSALQLTVSEPSENDRRYLFRHTITRDVAYQTLLSAQRRDLHRTVARWYERTYGTDGVLPPSVQTENGKSNGHAPIHTKTNGAHTQVAIAVAREAISREKNVMALAPYYERLAYHYREAEDVAKERRYTRLAAEAAAARFANTEALGYIERALSLTSANDHKEWYTLLLLRERIRDLQGERTCQEADLRALEKLVAGDEYLEWQAEVALRYANYYDKTNDYTAAIGAARRATQLANKISSIGMQAQGYQRWGIALWRQGAYQVSRSQLRRALMLSRRAGDRHVEADCLREMGNVSRELEDMPKARECYDEALRIVRELGDRIGESKALNNLGILYQAEGDIAQAWLAYEQALLLARELGDRLGEAKTLRNLGIQAQEQAEYELAEAHFQQALDLYQATRDRQGEAIVHSDLAMLLYTMGRAEAAVYHNEQALQIARELDNSLLVTYDRGGEGQGAFLRWAGDHRSR